MFITCGRCLCWHEVRLLLLLLLLLLNRVIIQAYGDHEDKSKRIPTHDVLIKTLGSAPARGRASFRSRSPSRDLRILFVPFQDQYVHTCY